ncbi:hypothetical protein [Burkholderia paludis]|nr:hypothetical protein [Burkholderia paludis]
MKLGTGSFLAAVVGSPFSNTARETPVADARLDASGDGTRAPGGMTSIVH